MSILVRILIPSIPILGLILLSPLTGCDRPAIPQTDDGPVSFADDLEFLRGHGDVRVLRSSGGGVVAVSDPYQGRVMTSAVSEDGLSFGWINRDFIEAGATGTAFDNYGGEDRFWLGPEGGQFSLYFPAEAGFVLDNWQVPASLQEGSWRVVDNAATGVTYRQGMSLTNYSGTTFDMAVSRTVRLVDAGRVSTLVGTDIPRSVEWIAYESLNEVTNTSDERWSPESGLVSIWILGMFETFGTSWVIVPFDGPDADRVITDSYFGEVPSDRLVIRDGYAVFKADGAYRSKIGVPAAFARPVLGSYSPEANALTVVHFDMRDSAARYVNSLWEIQDDPYGGDVVNSYNDGPPNPGGFYELESSSPALALSPEGNHVHRHTTMHFVGETAALDSIAMAAFGVGLRGMGID